MKLTAELQWGKVIRMWTMFEGERIRVASRLHRFEGTRQYNALAKLANADRWIPFDERARPEAWGFAARDEKWEKFVERARNLMLRAEGFIEVQPRGW